MAGQPVAAKETTPARDRKRHHHTIALLHRRHPSASLFHDPHELVAQNHVVLLREEPIEDVQVRAADRSRGDTQDDVLVVFDLRIWNLIDFDAPWPVKNDCFHVQKKRNSLLRRMRKISRVIPSRADGEGSPSSSEITQTTGYYAEPPAPRIAKAS